MGKRVPVGFATVVVAVSAAMAAASATGCGVAAVVGAQVGGNVPAVAAKARAAAARVEAFKDLDGNPAGLARFNGRPVVLSFLSPTDYLSQAQVPHLIRLAGAYQPEGVVFVAAGEKASLQELKDFARQADLGFPLWQDPGAAEFRSRGFTGLPAHQFVDRAGKVVVSRQGFMSRGELLEAIAAIL